VSSHYRIVPAGESVLIVEFEERIDPAVNATTIACAEAIQAAAVGGVRDVVPTYRSVAIYFDPLRTDTDALLERITHEAETAGPGALVAREPLRIPVCYGGDLGPDLPHVATFAKMTQ
jgi:allophanate hydrolase subunit 1